MGYPSYSTESYARHSRVAQTMTRDELFSAKKMNQSMNPFELEYRECRDSENHPDTVPIIIGLDVTGSMGYIPENIIKNELNTLVTELINAGIKDPSICFVAIGDHISDYAPLQVGQFESGDIELVKWLKETWLEGNGGGGNHESYNLAWLFAAKHTLTDAWDKRKQKGFIFTLGDERGYDAISNGALSKIMGYKQSYDVNCKQLLIETREKWNVHHIHVNDASYRARDVRDYWNDMLGQDWRVCENSGNLMKMITKMVIEELNPSMDKNDDGSAEPGHDTQQNASSTVGGSKPSML